MLKTEILSTTGEDQLAAAVARAGSALRAGAPVALPTETVYGLAANAIDPAACARIFEAKDRPLSDPLIVHLPSIEWLDRVARAGNLARRLAEKFWPGPLTLVLPRTEIVPDLVTAGQETVAVRMSAHPVFQEVAAAANLPLAAPSANRFGRISPTSAAAVFAELNGRIELILDGGSCTHGIESTIALVTDGEIQILRHGPITADELTEFAPVSTSADSKIASPGNLKSHYAPVTPLDLVMGLPSSGEGLGVLSWRPINAEGFAAVEVLSQTGDLREVAANLYAAMRRLDDRGLKRILTLPVPEEGLGVAIMERLRKAAARE